MNTIHASQQMKILRAGNVELTVRTNWASEEAAPVIVRVSRLPCNAQLDTVLVLSRDELQSLSQLVGAAQGWVSREERTAKTPFLPNLLNS